MHSMNQSRKLSISVAGDATNSTVWHADAITNTGTSATNQTAPRQGNSSSMSSPVGAKTLGTRQSGVGTPRMRERGSRSLC